MDDRRLLAELPTLQRRTRISSDLGGRALQKLDAQIDEVRVLAVNDWKHGRGEIPQGAGRAEKELVDPAVGLERLDVLGPSLTIGSSTLREQPNDW